MLDETWTMDWRYEFLPNRDVFEQSLYSCQLHEWHSCPRSNRVSFYCMTGCPRENGTTTFGCYYRSQFFPAYYTTNKTSSITLEVRPHLLLSINRFVIILTLFWSRTISQEVVLRRHWLQTNVLTISPIIIVIITMGW